MKERVVTTVRIRHHRIESMPHFMRLPVDGTTAMSAPEPIAASRGILTALAVSGVLWVAVIAAISL